MILREQIKDWKVLFQKLSDWPLFVFYQHPSDGLELQLPPVEHVPWSEAYKPMCVDLDLMEWNDVVPHVDIRHHANKRLFCVKSTTVVVLVL